MLVMDFRRPFQILKPAGAYVCVRMRVSVLSDC